MSNKKLVVLSCLFVVTSPLLAQAAPTSSVRGAPTAGPMAKYCMRIEAATGSRLEVVRCWTRDQWSEQGVDVDQDWAKEGVAVRDDGAVRP